MNTAIANGLAGLNTADMLFNRATTSLLSVQTAFNKVALDNATTTDSTTVVAPIAPPPLGSNNGRATPFDQSVPGAFVDMIKAEQLSSTSISVIKTADTMMGNVLDIRA